MLQTLKGPNRQRILDIVKDVASRLDDPLCKMAFLKVLALLSKTNDKELEEVVSQTMLIPPPPPCLDIIWENEQMVCSTLDRYVKEWIKAYPDHGLMENVVNNMMNDFLTLDKNMRLRMTKVILRWNDMAQQYLDGMEYCNAPGELVDIVNTVKNWRTELVKSIFEKMSERSNIISMLLTSMEKELMDKALESKDLILSINEASLRKDINEVIAKLNELQKVVEEIRNVSDSAGEMAQSMAVEAAKVAIPLSPPQEGSCVTLHDVLTLRGLLLPQMKNVIEGKMKLGGEEFGGQVEPFEIAGAIEAKGFLSVNKSFLRRKSKVFIGAIAYHSTVKSRGEDCNCFGLGDLKEFLANVPTGDYVAVAIITPNDICKELKEFFEKGYGMKNVGIVIYNPLEDEAVSSGEIGKELAIEARRLFGEEAMIKHVLKRLCERFEEARVSRDLIASYLKISEKEAEEVLKRLAKYLGKELRGGLYISSEDCSRL